ncbi:TetR/AcrR family transcriptional regulator [Phenylobacterium montanum]|uniref:TetR/AcrR family transcriptional regulator n=1 Tax=Phenylobacterium montanum TaxID=2823693 RepID=A0A975G3H3_9CAUL|nr:TetR/AcrR family transcriptional regulator [Caulobacter sp. S6]QUD90448.1 TetR/AcrR family transcriptional regulator [Caulobacter sp. S6]
MPKITDERKEARRQQILAAAVRCFSRDGFHATTTADIVREAGVSQGALYLYFATKDDIVVALADDRHQGETFLTALAQSEPDPVRGLFMLVELYGPSLGDAKRADERRVGIQGWAEALRSPAIHDSVVEGVAAVRKAIMGLVQRGQLAGDVRDDLDPEAVARTLIAIYQGLVLQAAWGEAPSKAEHGFLMREIITNTLLTPQGRAAASACAD